MMSKVYLLFAFVLFHSWGLCQTTVSLPIDFEGVVEPEFSGFDNASYTWPWTNPTGYPINPSSQGGLYTRAANEPLGGLYIDITPAMDFTVNHFLCMKVWTTRPVGTIMRCRIEGPSLTPIEVDLVTTISSNWSVLCYDFSGYSGYTRIVLVFDVGTSDPISYFIIDDIEQPLAPPPGISLPIDFEGPTPTAAQIQYFPAPLPVYGSAVKVPNPDPSGQNQSANVVRFIKGVNAPQWAGMEFRFLATATSGFAGAMPYLCFDYYTTAPEGTPITFKMVNPGDPGDLNSVTTVSGAWGQICYTPPTSHNGKIMPVIIFRLGTAPGAAGADPEWTLYVDNINQYATIPLAFTPSSQYFCPDAAVTLNTSVASDWYASQYGGVPLATSTTSYTTPTLSASTSYWVQDLTLITPPTISGQFPAVNNATGTSGHGTISTVQVVTAKINGTLTSVGMRTKVFGGTGTACSYTMRVRNLTTPTTYGPTTYNCGAACPDNLLYSFTTAVPLIQGNEYDLTITASRTAGTGNCWIGVDQAGVAGTNTYLDFDSHTVDGLPNSRWSSENWIVAPLPSLPPRAQVNAIADCPNALPIELLAFSVREQNGAALLAWSTGSELNNDRFLLFRTRDGIDFERVGVVHGAGNSSTVLHYTFLDRSPLKGLSYYKLTQVDFDGTESSSELVAFTNESSGVFRLFPNPTSEDLTLTMSEDYDKIAVRVYDLSGRLINQYLFASTVIATFRLQGHPGTYFLEVVADDHRKAMFKVLKL